MLVLDVASQSFVSRTRCVSCLSLALALTGACSMAEHGGQSGGYESGPAEESAGDGSADGTAGESGQEESGEQGSEGGEAACDADEPVALYLSPDDSNSTSSPVQVRAAVLGGWGDLGSAPIRTWEFLNYYGFEKYGEADRGEVRVRPEILRVEGQPEGEFVVQIGVASEHVDDADRPAMNVTLVLDESGSMDGHPIEMERAVCRQIAASLRAGDVVSMVGWDTDNAVKLAGHVVTGASDQTLVGLCDGLSAGGGTDLHGGLAAGYELAHAYHDEDRINRVVLISDGGANVGVTDAEIIAGGAGDQDADGIYLVGVGVGTPETYNDALMDTVTDVGRGASLFVPTETEAAKMFGARFVQTMAVAVRDVRVRLELPPGFSIVRFSGEEYSTDPAEVEPQHLAPNDVMVFHQTVATCAPELVDEAAELTVQVRWRDAVTFAERDTQVSLKIAEALAAQSPMLRKGAAVFAYAEALKEFRGTGDPALLQPAMAALEAAEAALPGDPDLAEIRQVLATLGG